MTTAADSDFDTPTARRLNARLAPAVTDHVMRFRRLTPEARCTMARGTILDELMGEAFGLDGSADLVCGVHSAAAGQAADVIARGIALLAFQPGGVTMFGRHYDAGAIIRTRCDQLLDETVAWCAARAAGLGDNGEVIEP